ncbi:response regulator transcription factor [Pseudoalteromonas arctica]|uniref:Response regulator transcription factor n=1 Tax=Pseudoalteromonas arctica TaxID=394751 RepID=A0A7Y0HC84_9GAMM|nr:LuxR C-terminal-related transcriptional regulator [Pseudoalteromonas arctica]NMM39804.1 response regulator transcription factor [Pseudoalteromonas arctica]
MIQPTSVFIKTVFKMPVRSRCYPYFIKTLDAFFSKVKMDDSLPHSNHRNEFDLFLIDSSGCNWQNLIPADLLALAKVKPVIVFNADSDAICEKNLLLNNFKGVFYHNDLPEDIFTGLMRIINDELWFSRKIISSTFNEVLAMVSHYDPLLSSDASSEHEALKSLTKREKSVVYLLAQGANNHSIAERLNISDHTVKTHLYSAFKKTNSRNRIELSNWALRYMAVRLPLHD